MTEKEAENQLYIYQKGSAVDGGSWRFGGILLRFSQVRYLSVENYELDLIFGGLHPVRPLREFSTKVATSEPFLENVSYLSGLSLSARGVLE